MSQTFDALSWDNENSPAPEVREAFRVEDDQQATWAMRKLAAARNRIAEIESIANAEIDRIQEWADAECRQPMRDAEYFKFILTEYARDQRATEGRKTISTPYGAVKSRMSQEKFVVEDQDAFLEWARKNHPEFIRVKELPDLVALKDSALNVPGAAVDSESGEVIPGLRSEPGSPTFTVEVSQ